jgi:UDP-N-acetylmuramyl pentapeptide phosphotransferase/UDP-N-acetylglucosamine-1-phosphate transferase
MTPKSAATLALIGVVLAAVLLIYDFVFDIVSVTRGLIPVVKLFPALIYAFAAFSLAVFVYVLRKTQHEDATRG